MSLCFNSELVSLVIVQDRCCCWYRVRAQCRSHMSILSGKGFNSGDSALENHCGLMGRELGSCLGVFSFWAQPRVPSHHRGCGLPHTAASRPVQSVLTVNPDSRGKQCGVGAFLRLSPAHSVDCSPLFQSGKRCEPPASQLSRAIPMQGLSIRQRGEFT